MRFDRHDVGWVLVLAFILILFWLVPPPAANASYRSEINAYVNARPQQAYLVQRSCQRAGWPYVTSADRTLMRQAILISAGESGMYPPNDKNKACSGLFQIQDGKQAYGVWTAAELASETRREFYTLRGPKWFFGPVRQYRGGRYIGNTVGWYVIPGHSGNARSDYRYGLVRTYFGGSYTGNSPDMYQRIVAEYPPCVGQYKIFNPVFNAEIARRMYLSRGWQPWTVAGKLGY